MTKEALKLALEALTIQSDRVTEIGKQREAIAAIKEALAQPVQPQRQWVGLTDTERNDIWKKEVGWGDPSHDDEDLMKAIEQALKEKNP